MPKPGSSARSVRPQISRSEQRIRRFPSAARPRLRALCRQARRFPDLLESFPAAALALASSYGSDEQQEAAFDLVKAGRPRIKLAEALGIELWLSELPPEAFRGAEDLTPIGLAPKDMERLQHHIQRDPKDAGPWLAWLRCAAKAGDSSFASWIASRRIVWRAIPEECSPELIAIYAWLSDHARDAITLLGVRPFSRAMDVKGAIAAAFDLAQAVRLRVELGTTGISETWLDRGVAGSFEFVPLTTLEELERQGQAMSNCVPKYARVVSQGVCRLFSVRANGVPVATLEIRPMKLAPDVPQIVQLLGARNAKVSADMWRAAFLWMGQQREFRLPSPGEEKAVRLDSATWERVFAGYLEAKGPTKLVPRQVGPDALMRLDAAAQQIAQIIR